MKNRFMLFLALSVLLLLAACGGGEPDPNAPLTSVDFDKVCKGEGVPRAAAYGQGGPYNVVVMADSTIGDQYDEYFTQFVTDMPEAWGAPLVDGTYDYGQVELIACIHRASTEFAEACEFEDNYVLNVQNATYELTLRAPQTAEIIAQETLSAAGSCPMLHMFDDTEEDYFEVLAAEQIIAFIEPHIEN